MEKKEPKKLLAEIVDNIARMMDRKTDAIRVSKTWNEPDFALKFRF